MGLGPALEVWLVYPNKTPLEKTDFSFFQQVSISRSFLIRSGNFCVHLPFAVFRLSDLNLCRSYSRCHSLCEVIGM